MSGLMRLDEKHKRAVELWLRGTPRQQIADELGIAKSTLFLWMKDPMILTYMEKLIAELEIRRQQRLAPAFEALVDLAIATIRDALRQRTSEDVEERLKAPGLKTVMDALQVLHGLERIDAGAPTSITKSITEETERKTGNQKKRTLMEELLDGIVVDGPHEIIDVTPEPDTEEPPENA